MHKVLWLLVGLFASLVVVSCSNEPLAPESLKATAAPTLTAELVGLNVRGRVVPVRWVALGFPSGGMLTEVNITIGQTVEQGEVLARLDADLLRVAVEAARRAVAAGEARQTQLAEAPDLLAVQAAAAELKAAEANLTALQSGPSQTAETHAAAELAAAQAELQALRALPDPAAARAAQARFESTAVVRQRAQTAYDQIRDRPEAAMLPEALALQQATIAHDEAQALLEIARRGATPSALAAALARVRSAQAALDAVKAGPSEVDLAAARSRVSQAEFALARVHTPASAAELMEAAANLAEARHALAQAESAVDGTVLVAPFAGSIVSVMARPQERVGSAPIIVLADLSVFQVETVDADEWTAAHVQPGQRVDLVFPALDGHTLPGIVSVVALQPAEANRLDPFYTITVTLSDTDPALRWGMTANVTFPIQS
ncbi:MAG: hypothetical protein CVU38_20100 [Chloroflexi bacterium HGW-Chloroflexi-1]|nr:MAG: hypothetical protein CVU38_20100 [Chloroflexi bacterium HGW-Chloroflexi-1]